MNAQQIIEALKEYNAPHQQREIQAAAQKVDENPKLKIFRVGIRMGARFFAGFNKTDVLSQIASEGGYFPPKARDLVDMTALIKNNTNR